MIKLQRAYWDEFKVNKTDLGSALVLPVTFSIKQISVSKDIKKAVKKYRTSQKTGNFNNNSINISGKIYVDGSRSDGENLKDEIISYCNVTEKAFIKIFRDEYDDKHWIGLLDNVTLDYQEKNSLIIINITFNLEEPYRISETKKTITSPTSAELLVSNTSNVEFYPEKVTVNNFPDGAVIRAEYDTGGDFETNIFTNNIGDAFYVKEFKNMTNLGNELLENLITIPAGDFYISGNCVLEFYERWI